MGPPPVRRRDGQPFAGDPRSVLERKPAEARAVGFDYRVAIELEYYLFQPDNAGLLPPPDTAGYFGTGPGLGTGTRDDVVASLAEMGIQVGGAHHETGPGQEELDLLTADPLRMADTVLTVREVIRAVAQRHGLRANFMPKPLADAPGAPQPVRAATVAGAAAAAGLAFDGHVVAALNGDQVTSDGETPLAAGDTVSFLPADAG